MKRNYREELLANAGKVFLPGGTWWEPNGLTQAVCTEDVWSFKKSVIRRSSFEQEFAVMIASAIARGDCDFTDDGMAEFIFDVLSPDRFNGKLRQQETDEYNCEIDLARRSSSDMIGKVLAEDPGRTMTRLMEKIDQPSKKQAQKRHIFRRCCYAWVWCAYAARVGRPEFCSMRVI